ncbi:MAG: SPOR domain-containing protein [Steroidobacteraceae bacterium]
MKERLTGAIILVALIVLLVPELLTGPPQVTPAGAPSAGATAAVAAAGSAAVHTYTLPLAAPAGTRAAPLAAPPPTHKSAAAPARAAAAPAVAAPRPAETSPAQAAEAAAVPVQPHPVAPRAQPRPVPQARPVARQAAAHAAARPPAGPRWAVQLGVFAFHADALRLAQRVRARGIPVGITPLDIRGRRLWRVASGSVRGRSAALALARRLSGFGFKGELLRP